MATQEQLLQAMNQRLMPNYGPRMRAMVRGAGSRIWDADGKEYIDFFVGFGGGGVTGHCHPDVVQAVCDQAHKLMSHGNFFTNEPELELAQMILDHSFPGKVFFCHSGTEANEAALKLVRLAAGPGRYKIISFLSGFHGRTMGALSLTSEKYQVGFEPMLAGNVQVPYGDLEAVAAAVDDETAGIFVEPIQGEGGVFVPEKSFMQGLRKLCDDKGLLLVCDEVWTSPARTGRWFAHQHFGITPDVMTLAKALGGGAPVAACVASTKYQDVLGPGKHGCTLGGNPLCTSAALAAMRLIQRRGLVERSQLLGEQIRGRIQDAAIPCVKAIRGLGLMIGLELDRPAKEVFTAALDAGLFICMARESVIRLDPALTVGEEDLDAGLAILGQDGIKDGVGNLVGDLIRMSF